MTEAKGLDLIFGMVSTVREARIYHVKETAAGPVLFAAMVTDTQYRLGLSSPQSTIKAAVELCIADYGRALVKDKNNCPKCGGGENG